MLRYFSIVCNLASFNKCFVNMSQTCLDDVVRSASAGSKFWKIPILLIYNFVFRFIQLSYDFITCYNTFIPNSIKCI